MNRMGKTEYWLEEALQIKEGKLPFLCWPCETEYINNKKRCAMCKREVFPKKNLYLSALENARKEWNEYAEKNYKYKSDDGKIEMDWREAEENWRKLLHRWGLSYDSGNLNLSKNK